jgi:hypothetical protein
MTTLIRRPAPAHSAGVLRGEKQAWDGEVERRSESSCRYCRGSGSVVYEDSVHPCWCVRDKAAEAADTAAKEGTR